MADDFGVYNITGKLEPTVSASLSTALQVSGNLNIKRRPTRITRDYNEVQTARSSSTKLMNTFVIPEISSSHYESTSLNAYLSGTQKLESTAVPASGAFYYSKQNKLVKYTFAVTASSQLATSIGTQDTSPATDEYAARATYLALSGTYINSDMFTPAVINFTVPNHGKIRDIKVWLEFINDHRGGPGQTYTGSPFKAGGAGDSVNNMQQGLQGVQVALRSPNVSFENAHPLWNDPTVRNFQKWPTGTDRVSSQFTYVPELLKNSYPLWAGHKCEDDLGDVLGYHTGSVSASFSIRRINSSSFGPGILGTEFADQTILNAYPHDLVMSAFRTIDVISTQRTLNDVNDQTSLYSPGASVLYLTTTGTLNTAGASYTNIDGNGNLNNSYTGYYVMSSSLPQSGTIQVMMNYNDNGTYTNANVSQFASGSLQFFSSSLSFNFNGMTSGKYVYRAPFSMHSPRIRQQRNSQYLHAICCDYSYGIVYGIRIAGSNNYSPWRLKSPIISYNGGQAFASPWGPNQEILPGPFVDFALDSRGKPHFIFSSVNLNTITSQLEYAFFSGSTAVYESTPPNSLPVTNTSDTIYPKHYEYYTGSIPGFTNASSFYWPDFMVGVLDNPQLNPIKDSKNPQSSAGPYCRIEIDTSDMIHVVYADVINKSVKYAKKQVAYTQWSGSWDFNLVFKHSGSSVFPTYISLDIDKNNKPHIAYALSDVSANSSSIYYAKSGSSGWETNLVSSTRGVKFGTNIKLDNDDNPVIITTAQNFDGNNKSALLMFTSNSSGWDFITLNMSSSNDPRTTSLMFDRNNKKRIYTGGEDLTAIWELSSSQDATHTSYDTDIDMRTIFTDSSKNLNPRNLSSLYDSLSDISPGDSKRPYLRFFDGRAYPSPFSASLPILQAFGVWGLVSASHLFDPPKGQSTALSGANIPWMLDPRIPPGIFHGLNYQPTTTSSIGWSPPTGWLTGPGGTANVNEFPTTGSNLGPVDLQPVYPLLDDIYVEKIWDQESLTSNPTVLPTTRGKIVGFRPGLRGTDINGTWKLMIGMAGAPVANVPTAGGRNGIWFRQARIEFTVDEGEGTRATYDSKKLRFKKSGTPQKPGKRRVAVMSGSSEWDIGISYVFVEQQADYGRSYGITSQTDSNQFAVFSQLTGTFVDILSGSGDLESVQSTYLTNEFGTPYIPLSAGSAEPPSFDVFSTEEVKKSRDLFTTTLNPSTLIPRDNTLRSALARADVIKSTRDTIISKLKP